MLYVNYEYDFEDLGLTYLNDTGNIRISHWKVLEFYKTLQVWTICNCLAASEGPTFISTVLNESGSS